jgi:hypothetical protein
MLSIGIDPGLSGAFAAITRVGMPHVWDMPTLALGGKTKGGHDSNRRVLDRKGLKAVLANIVMLAEPGEPIFCVVERQLAFSPPGRKVGATSMFSLGDMYGSLLTALAFLEIPYEPVMSQKWKADVLDGTGKDKQAAIIRVQSLYPAAQLVPKGCRVPADGRADALCIAHHARRRFSQYQHDLPLVSEAA